MEQMRIPLDEGKKEPEKLTFNEAYWQLLTEHRKNIKRDGTTTENDNGLYQCTKCNDSGIEMYNVECGGWSFPMGRICACQALRARERRFKQSGIPSAFDNKTFDNFHTDDNNILALIKQKAIEFVETYSKDGPSLFFTGMSGAGKTHLSVAICSALIEKGVNVYYMIYREEITKLKQVYFNEEKYADAIEPFKKVELLYIDDLFKGKTSDNEVNIMYEIINYRYNNKLPMIISTEMSLEGIRHLESATAGRIDEMCHWNGAKNIVNFGRQKDRRDSTSDKVHDTGRTANQEKQPADNPGERTADNYTQLSIQGI